MNHKLPIIMFNNRLEDQKTLDTMKHPIKDHYVYHIDTEDDSVFDFLRDFNLIDCTNVKINKFILYNM